MSDIYKKIYSDSDTCTDFDSDTCTDTDLECFESIEKTYSKLHLDPPKFLVSLSN